jgi:alpha-galactosidase
MLNSKLKELVNAFNEVKHLDLISNCETYNEYLWWGKTILDIKVIREVE